MQNNEKISVISGVSGRIGLTIKDRNYHRVWPKKGAKILVDRDILREGIYENGVEYLFKNGLLIIEDKAFRQELGLEPFEEEVKEVNTTVNNVVLTDQLLDRYLNKMPAAEFKGIFKNLSSAQKQEVINYAVENDIINGAKVDYIKELTDFDILKAITLKRQNEEKVKNIEE